MIIRFEDLPKVANQVMNALHEDEVELINQLYDACMEGDKEKVDKLLELLLYDIEEHFSTEEELMRESEFFAYPMDKAEHDRMREEVRRIYELWKDKRDPKIISSLIKDRFVPWLFLHISTFDNTTAFYVGD